MSDDAGSEDRRTCPSCGAEAKPGISNCDKCWRPLPVGSGPVTPSGIQERRYCPSCSVEVKPGVSTCQSCWRPLPLGADLSAPPISQRSEATSPAPKDLQSATSQPVTTARTEPSTNEPPASAASAVHIDSSPDSQIGREPKLGGDQGVHAPPKTPNQSTAASAHPSMVGTGFSNVWRCLDTDRHGSPVAGISSEAWIRSRARQLSDSGHQCQQS